MKKTFFLFTALVAAASCKQVEITVPETEETFREVSIVASALDTKTQLQDDNTVVWEQDDKIMLKFSPAEGQTVAVRTSEFAIEGEAGATATFKGQVSNAVTVDAGYSDDVYAVYPSAAMADGGVVTWTVKAEQTVEPGSFPSDANLSSAAFSLTDLIANDVTETSFKNALSIIRFTVPEYVDKVAVTGTSALTGERTMTFGTDGVLQAETVEATEEDKTITLTPASDASFAHGSENVYNILVYPGEHTSLAVNLTDIHGCTLSKTIDNKYEFVAGKYYNFNFKSEFTKTYSFTSDLVPEGENKVLAVFSDRTQELNYADGKFTGYLNASQVHAETPEVGYAVYPRSAYDAGTLNYNISDPLAEPSVLMVASLPVETLKGDSTPEIAFTSVESALATLKFTVPAGVKSVKIVSGQEVVGLANINFDRNEGALSVGCKNGSNTIELGDLSAQEYSLTIYPVSDATFTVTLTDAAGASVEQTFTVTVAAGEEYTLNLDGDLDFDKDGSFGNENFEDGLDGGNIEF